MPKSEWMMTETEVIKCYAYRGSNRDEAWLAIAAEAQTKLLEYLIAQSRNSVISKTQVMAMLKQLGETST